MGWLQSEADHCLLLPPAGSVQALSSQSLRASSSAGTDPHTLLYQVLAGPRLGQLLHSRRDSIQEALGNFTQAEVRARPLARQGMEQEAEGAGSSSVTEVCV